jgi:MerR family transcriptional regulator, copper efflux regulator
MEVREEDHEEERGRMAHMIGEVARRAGVNVETVRYYERRGLVADPPRTDAGYRQYPDSTVRRIRFVKRAQELGFSLREIAELLDLRVEEGAPCAAVLDRTRAKMADIDRRIADLEEMRAALEPLVDACAAETGATDCVILDHLSNDARNDLETEG